MLALIYAISALIIEALMTPRRDSLNFNFIFILE